MGTQADYEAATLGAYYRQMDASERLACAVEAEMEQVCGQTVADLMHGLPVPWRQRLEDLAYEIAEVMVALRYARSLEDLAAARLEDLEDL